MNKDILFATFNLTYTGGNYVYIGIADGLKKIFEEMELPETIYLSFNIDG